MAKVVIAGDAVVVTSSKKLEDIKTLERYNPKSLSLYEPYDNGKMVETFRVGSTEGAGAIGKFGISFGSATHDENGYATVTMLLPDGVEDAVGYVADAIGYSVMKLNKIEEGINLALGVVEAEKEAILQNITVA